MQTGVSTASLFMRKYNEEALPLLNDLGVKTAEVFLTSFSEYGKEFGEVLAKVKGNLTVNSVHALNTEFEPQLFSAHPRVKADAYGWLDKVLESAVCLDAPYYSFHGTSRVKKASRSGKYDDFPSMIRGFDELTAHCKARGVTLCLENVEWSTYNRLGVFATLAEALPELRGVLDIKQARISGYPYEEYLREMGEKLAHVHISDVDERGKIRLPGQGVFDFDTLVKRLKDVGFDGALLIEVYKNDYTDVTELKTACDFVDEILYKNNVLQ
ncbi:MAG: sugar phosphate isomerase/epimerase [Clostridiales bacterium]|nr:sugar phosphate isomerase/epimerase [Clostridiales bacterium]